MSDVVYRVGMHRNIPVGENYYGDITYDYEYEQLQSHSIEDLYNQMKFYRENCSNEVDFGDIEQIVILQTILVDPNLIKTQREYEQEKQAEYERNTINRIRENNEQYFKTSPWRFC